MGIKGRVSALEKSVATFFGSVIYVRLSFRKPTFLTNFFLFTLMDIAEILQFEGIVCLCFILIAISFSWRFLLCIVLLA